MRGELREDARLTAKTKMGYYIKNQGNVGLRGFSATNRIERLGGTPPGYGSSK